jgi:hypothetical protein
MLPQLGTTILGSQIQVQMNALVKLALEEEGKSSKQFICKCHFETSNDDPMSLFFWEKSKRNFFFSNFELVPPTFSSFARQ